MQGIAGSVGEYNDRSDKTASFISTISIGFDVDQKNNHDPVACCTEQQPDMAGHGSHCPLDCKLLISIDPRQSIRSTDKHLPFIPNSLESHNRQNFFRPPIV